MAFACRAPYTHAVENNTVISLRQLRCCQVYWQQRMHLQSRAACALTHNWSGCLQSTQTFSCKIKIKKQLKA
jgi:hypothetical protein